MQRMMQASGTSEGLRTLIDSSLPASVKNIMANRATFGPAIFAIGKLALPPLAVSLTDP